MKDSYRKLKRAILHRTMLITALTAVIGYVILMFLVDGILDEFGPKLAVRFFEALGADYNMARYLYGRIFVSNKTLFLVIGFWILFLILFYFSIGRMTGYLNDISDEIDRILNASDEPVTLAAELEPMARKLSELKSKLARREMEAAESEQRKNDLVVYLAHDLKTPLTSVIAYLTMLDEHPDMAVEERAKYTHITLEKAVRLGELINEFFEITRFNLQDIVLEKKGLDLSMLLEQLADESYGMLSEKKMTCAVDVEEGLTVWGDPDKLARVFDNLLRNAAAYSYEGTEILIQARRGGGKITIVFTNTGPQIPQKKLEMIFEKFYRVDDARSSQTGGAGLGLAIARQIVELHGGIISAVSDSRHTRFIVSLPAREDTVQEIPPQKDRAGRKGIFSRGHSDQKEKKTRAGGQTCRKTAAKRRQSDGGQQKETAGDHIGE